MDIAGKRIRQRRQDGIIGLTFDELYFRFPEQRLEKLIAHRAERRDDIAFEDRIPALDLLPLDRPITRRQSICREQIGIRPTALVTGIVTDLGIDLLQI